MNAIFRAALPALAIVAACFVAPSASADQPGAHPGYLHALSDLRSARANLERRGGDLEVRWDEGQAIGEIDAAIVKLRIASIDDGKNLNDHPPVDAREPRRGRLHRALIALEAAYSDVNREEDNAFALGVRQRALGDISVAIMRTRESLCDAGDAFFCPKN